MNDRPSRRQLRVTRACLRHLGVPSAALDAATVAALTGPPGSAVRGVLAAARRYASLGPGEVDPEAPPASHVLREFSDQVGERERALFVMSELAGVRPTTLARHLEISAAEAIDGVIRARGRFAAFAAAQGVPPRELLAAAALAERLSEGAAQRLGRALEQRRAAAQRSRAARRLWLWLAACAPALVAAAWVVGGAPALPTVGEALAPSLARRALAVIASSRPRVEVEAAVLEVEAAPAAAEPLAAAVTESSAAAVAAAGEAPARGGVVEVRARRRSAGAGGPRAARSKAAQAERAALAAERDPGRVIFELEILKAAKEALGRSPRQTLHYADQHAREFPNGQFAAVREALRVEALCLLRRGDEARALAEREASAAAREALRRCAP
ncbi:MAG: hypothetical protein IPK80_12570 [Nannocystis sp.]|nr:hypothetical protein [Nannocystis sp.]